MSTVVAANLCEVAQKLAGPIVALNFSRIAQRLVELVVALIFLTGSGDAGVPEFRKHGYDILTKRELWETARTFEAQLDGALLALEQERIAHGATKRKLAARTSTAIQSLVVPPVCPVAHSTETLIFSNALTLLGTAVGCLMLSQDSTPQTIVVK